MLTVDHFGDSTGTIRLTLSDLKGQVKVTHILQTIVKVLGNAICYS